MIESSKLTAKQLTVGFDRNPIVEDVTLELIPGRVLAIAGANGAGKSTLIKTLARVLKPLRGEVLLSDKNIWDFSARDFAQQIAYVPQLPDLEQDLTVQELVLLGRNPHQMWWSWHASQHDRDAVKQALEKTHLWNLRDKYISNLSGGERQRALVATALAQEPKFMLLDEPVSHLDFRHQLELVELISELRKQEIGIAVILHDMNLIAKLADQVILLQKLEGGPSKIVATGTPKEVFQPNILKQVFDVNVRLIPDAETQSSIYLPVL